MVCTRIEISHEGNTYWEQTISYFSACMFKDVYLLPPAQNGDVVRLAQWCQIKFFMSGQRLQTIINLTKNISLLYKYSVLVNVLSIILGVRLYTRCTEIQIMHFCYYCTHQENPTAHCFKPLDCPYLERGSCIVWHY